MGLSTLNTDHCVGKSTEACMILNEHIWMRKDLIIPILQISIVSLRDSKSF